MLQSCGVADVVATCFGGRNRLCAAEFAKRLLEDEKIGEGENELQEQVEISESILDEISSEGNSEGSSEGSSENENENENGNILKNINLEMKREKLKQLWIDVENELLGGQKLQGLGTCDELTECLRVTSGGKGSGSESESGSGDGMDKFPLFRRIHAIARLGDSPSTLFDWD